MVNYFNRKINGESKQRKMKFLRNKFL